ncbi:hypothetical protein [Acinetobacter sp. WCHAc060007]|uniref:hypothetical protein n=1 Tax=Acinetobacter sp. WCHAc060007 TaxID=2419605 RepID=UPI000EA0F2E6|nr:hypothetical protein [Acinetobacter sp. WCHAc060007]RKG37885.1 hypothetical protein D7V31_16045 [Acinetobacter sp. WCHAc060007]
MSFITQEQAEQILGADFAPAGDKARLIKLANTWMRSEVGFVPDPLDPLLLDATCEIIKGIQAGVIYAGIARQTISESVKADTVQVTEAYAEGSVEISEFEQIARAYIDSLNLKSKGFTFEVFRA